MSSCRLLAQFSGEVVADVDKAPGCAWVVTAPADLSTFPAELFWAFISAAWVADVQLGGEVLGLAPGFGFFSCSLGPWEPLGPFALAASRFAPAAAVPLTTGAPADAAFAFVATLLSPGFFFAFVFWLSPGLFVALRPSDFMADAALRGSGVLF